MNKEKIVSAVISAIIIAGAGGYAYATQAAPRQTSLNTSTAVCSSATSTSSTQSSVAPQESSEAVSKVPAPVITPPKPIRPSSSESSAPSSSRQTTSLIPEKEYFDVVDPETGRYINPDNPKYFIVKKQLGGDAGEVSPDKSTACAPIIKEWNEKEIRK